MDILKNFGFDPLLFGAQIVNFLILFFVLRRFLLKPVLSVIKSREDTIKLGLKKAEEATKLLEKTKAEEKTILHNAQLEARKFLTLAKAEATDIAKIAQLEAKKETTNMIEEAKGEIARETTLAEERLAKHVSTLAVEFLQKAVSEIFTEKEQGEIMTKAMKTLHKKSN